MTTDFDAQSLPAAISALFEMNNYDVTGPVQIHGAEIDLVATPKADPFGAKVYIEATIEYVDNEKYGKDVGKLALVAAKEPTARRLIVSARGISLPVQERAKESGIDTLTYRELFSRFERFDGYFTKITDGDFGRELDALLNIYEEPNFEDDHGVDRATRWLEGWYLETTVESPWLIVTGEYGTGKTALTKVLLRRWIAAHLQDPLSRFPFA